MGTAHRQRTTRPGGRAGSPLWSCAVVGARVSARPAHLQRCMSSMPPPNPMPRFIAAVRANLRAREREPAREHRKGGTARRRFANRSLFYILHIVRTCAQTPSAYPGDPSKKSCGKFRGDAVTRRRWWVSCDVRGRTIQFEEAVIGSEEERCTALAGAAAAAARGVQLTRTNFLSQKMSNIARTAASHAWKINFPGRAAPPRRNGLYRTCTGQTPAYLFSTLCARQEKGEMQS